MKPKVSVIIPAYNCEKYITDCIKSVINQSYENLEIIIINDGSTDSTLEIMQKFSAEDSRIVLVDKENGGVGSARNAGLDIATG
ncbi:MAG: glycosyltransferase family 2 protein, partial [Candidatus Saccharibacteria bacterium]|nr:glycosyltransferase family 2 protein [Candidatus Saccharibacteria bacterium]